MSANRPPSLVPLLLALTLVIAPPFGGAALLALVTALAPDGDQYVPTLDALTIPDNWETVSTKVVDGGFMTKARATRYYFADLDPVDGVSAAKAMARAAGFSIHPHATDCDSYNGGLPTDCTIEAVRLLDSKDEYVEHLWIGLNRRGSSFTIATGDQRTTVSDPERALISIGVDAFERKYFEPTLVGSPIPGG